MRIDIDYREKTAGLAELLAEKFQVQFLNLPAGDYRLEGGFLVERKTARDFVLSIIDSRLFTQVARLKQYTGGSLLLIEGNPYRTEISMAVEAIRGALLSVTACWQMPVVFSRSISESVEILRIIAAQKKERDDDMVLQRGGYRPKRLKNRQLYVLQGLPGVGPKLAGRLLDCFRSVEGVMNASAAELTAVEGVGPGRAETIRSLLTSGAVK